MNHQHTLPIQYTTYSASIAIPLPDPLAECVVEGQVILTTDAPISKGTWRGAELAVSARRGQNLESTHRTHNLDLSLVPGKPSSHPSPPLFGYPIAAQVTETRRYCPTARCKLLSHRTGNLGLRLVSVVPTHYSFNPYFPRLWEGAGLGSPAPSAT